MHGTLDEVEAKNPKSARIVEQKFFTGLAIDEIADVAKIPRASVVRESRSERAWLAMRLVRDWNDLGRCDAP